jgi:hypothetical protein
MRYEIQYCFSLYILTNGGGSGLGFFREAGVDCVTSTSVDDDDSHLCVRYPLFDDFTPTVVGERKADDIVGSAADDDPGIIRSNVARFIHATAFILCIIY